MATVIQDTFTEAANTNLDAHTPDTGTGWTDQESTGAAFLRVNGTNDECEPGGNNVSARLLYTAEPAATEADVDVFYTVAGISAGADDPMGCVARWADSSNFYSGGSYPSAAAADKKIFKEVAGVVTELGSADNGLSVGDRIKLELRGTAIKLYHDTGAGFGTALISVTDSAISAAGKGGVMWGNLWVGTDDAIADNKMDDFQMDEFAAANTATAELAALAVTAGGQTGSEGSIDAQLAALAGTMAGTFTGSEVTGTATAALSALKANVTGVIPITGTLAAQLQALVASATGNVTAITTSDAAAFLSALTGSASGRHTKWTIQDVSSDSWLVQDESSGIWILQSEASDGWTVQ